MYLKAGAVPLLTVHLSLILLARMCAPTVRFNSDDFETARSEDDLTHKLAEIIKANNKLRRQDQNGAPQHIIREFSQLLQFHITTYFDNTKPGQPVASQVQAIAMCP